MSRSKFTCLKETIHVISWIARIADCRASPCFPNPCKNSANCFITKQADVFTNKCQCTNRYEGDHLQYNWPALAKRSRYFQLLFCPCSKCNVSELRVLFFFSKRRVRHVARTTRLSLDRNRYRWEGIVFVQAFIAKRRENVRFSYSDHWNKTNFSSARVTMRAGSDEAEDRSLPCQSLPLLVTVRCEHWRRRIHVPVSCWTVRVLVRRRYVISAGGQAADRRLCLDTRYKRQTICRIQSPMLMCACDLFQISSGYCKCIQRDITETSKQRLHSL